jgi:uncharacterized membrane protein YbaN (DUF454 family)
MPPGIEENTEGSVGMEATPGLSRRFYRISRIALGIALLIAGLAGLVLPVLQGVILIVAALAILRKDIPFVATIWDRFVVPMQQRYRRWRDARRYR